MIHVNGIVMQGHGVASGRGPNSPYPTSSLRLQKTLFKERGLDLSVYFEGTLNLSIAPHVFTLHHPQFTFHQVAWTNLHPPEDFSFSCCRVLYRGVTYDGWVYYPHPETKIRHFQDSTIIEVIAPFIPDLTYGDVVELELNPAEITLDPHMPQLPTGYDPVAGEYAEKFFHELQHKPFDRELLDRFAEKVKGRGPVCDLGCGPGQIARYLHAQGVDAFGLDLSPAMIETARRLNPGLRFEVGDMQALHAADGAWGGIAAFYSIIHIPREKVVGVLQGLRRVLRSDGLLLLAFHIGEQVVHLDEWWNKPVSLDFYFFTLSEMKGYLREAGFVVEEVLGRAPYEEVEHPSHRGYIWARKP